MAAAVGCGGGSDQAALPACASPGVTPDSISLGLVYSDTGSTAPIASAARAGMDARLGEVNAAGGVNGRQITYKWRDDASDLAQNQTVTQELVERENVFGLVTYSATIARSMEYLAQNDVPVTGRAMEGEWGNHNNMFSFFYRAGAPVDTYGRFIRGNGGTRAVILQTDLGDSVNRFSAGITRSMATAGVEVVRTVSYAATGSSPIAAAREIQSAGADTVIGVLDPPSLAAVLDALREAGTRPKVTFAVTGYDRALLQRLGPSLAGTTIPLAFRPFEAGGEALDRFRSSMVEYAPQETNPNSEGALLAYLATDMMLRGIEMAGACPTREGVVTQLRTVTDYDGGGLLPAPADFSRNLGRPQTCFSFVKVNEAGNGFDVASENVCGNEITP